MARAGKTKETANSSNTESPKEERIFLGRVAAKPGEFKLFSCWLVGQTPLIVHAWSEKARREMLDKQVKVAKSGREAKDPYENFQASLYRIDKDTFGFPATGVKNAILSSAHKDKGIPRSTVMSALWIDSDIVRTRPALAGAICDMPLLRVYGEEPQMREDMVRIGAGLNKKADLAYRGQFRIWAIRLTGRFNSTVLPLDQLVFLITEAGMSIGLGEWRNEKRGMFGSFAIATPEEEEAWEAFANGTGPLPVPEAFQIAAE